MFKVLNTSDAEVHFEKTLLCAHHGWGKTTQAINVQNKYGKTLIISLEGGLKSLEHVSIDVIPVATWDGDHNPESGVFSFRGAMRMIASEEFKSMGYTAIFIDSVTELSDQLMEFLEEKHAGNKNGFEKWGDNSRLMIGALKWIRDLDMHVVCTCLLAEEDDDNGLTTYWPMVKGSKVAKQIPALFDHVFCGIRHTDGDRTNPKVTRYLATDQVRGYYAKARDPRQRLRPIEKSDDITKLFAKMAMPEGEWDAFINRQKKAAQTDAAAKE
jgi:hypothetical protein